MPRHELFHGGACGVVPHSQAMRGHHGQRVVGGQRQPHSGHQYLSAGFGHVSRLAGAGFRVDDRQAGHTSAKVRMDNAP
ncbi:MAG: hypothetical protein Q8S32_06300 [Burkholderiaceae bacterium]|nr:hypothetical protein [Burkholderiaceae bacterium]